MEVLWLIFLSMQFIDVGTMVSPTVFARRSLCYLFCDQPDAALADAMQAQIVNPDWPTAFYMQSVALAKLDMHKDAADMLNEATGLEEKKQRGMKGSWEQNLSVDSTLVLVWGWPKFVYKSEFEIGFGNWNCMK